MKNICIGICVFLLPLISSANEKLWFANFNYKLGLSTTYSDGVNNHLNSIGATNKSTSGLEIGAHFKMVVPTLFFGGTLTRYVNKFDSNAGDNITLLTPAASLVYSPKENMADGPFGRVDAGMGFVSKPGTSDAGLTFLLGFGWGFPFNDDFAMFPIFTYSTTYGTENYSFTTLGVGFIF